jgi:CheY-like chemotaxis protein
MNANLDDVLSGKRVWIVGVERSLAKELVKILRSAGANPSVGTEPEGAFDLIVASPAAGAHVDVEPPLLVLGPLESMLQGRGRERSDFLVAPPLRADEVLLRSFRLLTGRRRPAVGTSPTVLAVDDDATTTAIVRAIVTRSGIRCEVAANGREALEAARVLEPSVVVLDVNMPFVDGFEVLAKLKNDPATAHIAVVMLTSVQQESDIVRGFGLGADDYVVKPFNPMELLARIKRLVRRT